MIEFIDEVGGIYFRSIILQKGQVVDQHTHDYDHATYIGSGSVEMYADNKPVGTVPAGRAVLVKAGVYHVFSALENNTRLTCVHDVKSAESIKVKGA